MPMRISMTDSTSGKTVDIDVEPTTTIDEIIESAAAFWEKDPGAYIVTHYNNTLKGENAIGQLGLQAGEMLTMTPDPTGG